eukprot:jgi/Ulvmu1/790/UM010_0164.1
MAQIMNTLKGFAGNVDAFIKSVDVDDSQVPYMELVLGFMALEYVFHTYLDIRQRQAIATQDPPEELKDNYTDEHLKKTRAYSLDKKNFGLLKDLYDSAESFSVLIFGMLPFTWSLCENYAGKIRPGWESNEYAVSVLFTLLAVVIQQIEGLPWSAYFNFVIEARHGFNKQTLSIFLMDKVKGLLITFALAPPILCAAIYILKLASPYMPLYLWAFLFVLQMVMLVAYPSLIAPLFNKYSPLPEGSLRDGIEALAGQLAFPLRKLYVVDGSKRSGHANAYMYGFGSSKRIVLYDTLMEQCDESQVVAVLAHELGHWKLGHTWCLMALQQVVVVSQFMLFAVVRSSPHLLAAFGFTRSRPVIVSLMLFSMVSGPLDKLISWLFNLLSRRYEFQADAFAVKMKHAPELQEALKNLDKENKSDFVVDRLYSQYHYSHPPLVERLRAIQAAAKKVV